MSRIILGFSVLSFCILTTIVFGNDTQPPPNIVIIVADDLVSKLHIFLTSF